MFLLATPVLLITRPFWYDSPHKDERIAEQRFEIHLIMSHMHDVLEMIGIDPVAQDEANLLRPNSIKKHEF